MKGKSPINDSQVKPVPLTQNADQVLEDEFLEVRSLLITVAATFDRIDAAGGVDVNQSEKQRLLHQAIAMLVDGDIDRCRRMQELFSLPYDPQWREKFGI